MDLLDRTEQRIVGVLIEKQLAVPDSYPLSDNALLAGCNQTSNRDPVFELQSFEVAGALMSLHEKEWVAKVEGGGRVARYRHRTDERLGLDNKFMPVLAELLMRGPQAPGALKPRVGRMGLTVTPSEIEAMLRELAGLPSPLVEQLPRRPRERDQRWRHLLGDSSETVESPDASADRDTLVAVPARAAPLPTPPPSGLADRVTSLEQKVEELQRIIDEMRSMQSGD